jgi:proteasome lid subunit RPN8/RPN11
VKQRNAKAGPPPPLQISKPFPDDRTILWTPGEGLAHAPELAVPTVVITQGALREVIRHLSSAPDQELLGFLIGDQCECPRTKRRYVCITATLRTSHSINEAQPVQIPDAEWLGQQLEVRRRRSTLIGWYHSSPFLSPSPASLDLETHRARFTEPWQCGLIIATEGNEPAGGFFRAHDDPSAGGAYIPFHEQMEEEAILEGGRFRTLIDWTSYATTELVEHDERERSVHRAGAANPANREETGMTLPLMIPSPPEDPVRSRPMRSRWVSVGISGAIALAITAVALVIWNARRLPEPPATALERPRPTVAVPPAAPAPLDTMATPGLAAGPADSLLSAPAPANSTTVVAPIPSEIRTTFQSRFDSVADSLEQGLRNYRDRRSDFAQKRLSCQELAYGYRAADEALVALAPLTRDARMLDAQRRARYTRLTLGMDSVNVDFDSSKCRRL